MTPSIKQHVCECDEPCLQIDGNGGFFCVRCGHPAPRVPDTSEADMRRIAGRLLYWAKELCDSDMDAEDMLE